MPADDLHAVCEAAVLLVQVWGGAAPKTVPGYSGTLRLKYLLALMCPSTLGSFDDVSRLVYQVCNI